MGPPLDHHRHLARGAGAGPCPHHGRALSVLPAGRFSREGQLKEAEVTRTAPSSSQPVHGNIRHGFVYERVPHITLKSIANNAEIDVIWEKWQADAGAAARAAQRGAQEELGGVGDPARGGRQAGRRQRRSCTPSGGRQRIARQKEIDASIAAKAEFEYLYDKPYEDKKKVRVAGPFTVESLSPAPRARRGRERRTDRQRRGSQGRLRRGAGLRPDDPGEPQDRRRAAGAQGRQDHLHRRSRPGRATSSAPRAATSKATTESGTRSAPPSSSAPSSAPSPAPTWWPPPARLATPTSTC